MTTYKIELTKTGDILDDNLTLDEASNLIDAYIQEDEDNDEYEAGYYQAINEQTGKIEYQA